MPDTPNAEEDFLFNSETGTVEKYIGTAVDVVIPRSIGGVEVRAIGGEFAGNIRDFTGTEIINNQTEWVHVRTLVIPETVTRIEDAAFEYCQQLETVICYAPLETTGRMAFHGDTSLKTVVYMNPLKAIDNYCFADCPALETVWYSGTLDLIGEQAFHGSGLKTFTADAKVIGPGAFMLCEQLESVHVRGSIERMQLSAFGKCSALNEICLETVNDEVFTGENGYSGECGGDTRLILPAETTDKQAKYILRMWHTSNFGPIPDEEHVIRSGCTQPENPPRPDVAALGFAAPEK